MEHCPDHSGIVEALNTLKDAAAKIDDVVEKVTDIRVKTARTSAMIGSLITGGALTLAKIAELIIQHVK